MEWSLEVDSRGAPGSLAGAPLSTRPAPGPASASASPPPPPPCASAAARLPHQLVPPPHPPHLTPEPQNVRVRSARSLAGISNRAPNPC